MAVSGHLTVPVSFHPEFGEPEFSAGHSSQKSSPSKLTAMPSQTLRIFDASVVIILILFFRKKTHTMQNYSGAKLYRIGVITQF